MARTLHPFIPTEPRHDSAGSHLLGIGVVVMLLVLAVALVSASGQLATRSGTMLLVAFGCGALALLLLSGRTLWRRNG